jgi:hypothetical protein
VSLAKIMSKSSLTVRFMVALSCVMLAVAKKKKDRTTMEKLKPVFMAVFLFGGFFTVIFVIGDFIGI